MPKALTGLQGLQGWVNPKPEASASELHGGTVDPAHGDVTKAETYPWEVMPGQSVGPYGLDNGLLGMDIVSYVPPAGKLGTDPTADLQPLTHAAPWPRGINQNPSDPDAVGEVLQESADIHSFAYGASRRSLYSPTELPTNDDWTDYVFTDPGSSNQVPIPQQVMTGSGGWGSTDRIQSMQAQNEYGFDSAHRSRRWAEGSIPGNNDWMRPGGRPLVKSIPGGAINPTGKGSPFEGQDTTQSFDTQGSVLQVLPTDYSPSRVPSTASSYDPIQASPAISLW